MKVGGGGGGGGEVVIMVRKACENLLPYYIQNLKICIKISILLLNIVHFLAMQLS